MTEEDETDEPEREECEFCGENHESRDCDMSFCRKCRESVDNCDCEHPDEIDAEEYLKMQ